MDRWVSEDGRIDISEERRLFGPRRLDRWYPHQPNGWWPRLSPTAEFVAYGNVDLYLTDLRTREERKIETGGQHANILGWWDDTTFIWVAKTRDDAQFLFAEHVSGGRTKLDVDPALVVGNWHDADSGHWCSSVAPTRRIVYDGRVLSESGLGCACAGDWLVFATEVAGIWALRVYRLGRWQRDIRPQAGANTFDIDEHGTVCYGYFGPARLNFADGSDFDVTVTPWRGESPPAIHDDGDHIWLASGCEGGTSQFVAVRKYSDPPGHAIVIPGGAVALSMDTDRQGRRVVAFCGDRGQMVVAWLDGSEPYQPLRPTLITAPEPLWCGAFFQFSDRYGDDPSYPSNCTVVVEPGAVSRAVAAGKRIIVNADPAVLSAAAPHADRVLALYIGDTGGWRNAQRDALAVKALWQSMRLPARPVLWYVTPADAQEVGFQLPEAVDWLGPEFYFDAPHDLDQQRWRKLAWWIARLGRSKPWIPIFQAYDRNLSPAWKAEIGALAATTPAFLSQLHAPDPRVGTLPTSIGLLFFAVMRPGGVKDYPALRLMHEAVFAAIPGTPPAEEDDLVLKKPEVTVEKYSRISQPGGEAVFIDRENPDLGLRVRVWNEGGNIFMEIEHKGGEGRTRSRRPA